MTFLKCFHVFLHTVIVFQRLPRTHERRTVDFAAQNDAKTIACADFKTVTVIHSHQDQCTLFIGLLAKNAFKANLLTKKADLFNS